jgi:23S rRNA (adenine2503-C2)-methyltransferase
MPHSSPDTTSTQSSQHESPPTSAPCTQGAEASRPELIGLSPDRLCAGIEGFLAEMGEPTYRVRQIEEWIYVHRARAFDEMTPLPGRLREALDAQFSLTPLEPAYEARSSDGTVKHLWRLADGEQVEAVLIPSRERVTLCLSSQVGCALACRFCATGFFGFRRQLRAAEIVAQYREAERFVAGGAASKSGSGKAWPRGARRISNVVYMGMGEPLANLDAVIDSLEVLHRGFGLGARRITVSTVGLVPGILELARRPEQFDLAVSLHAPLHDLRLELMPIEQRYPLLQLFDALREYQSRKNRRISFEYTLIDGVNDDPALADALADLTFGLTCFVNLIPFNPIPDQPEWRASTRARVRAFSGRLEQRGVGNAVRTPRGRDIAAACGQLRLARLAAEN